MQAGPFLTQMSIIFDRKAGLGGVEDAGAEGEGVRYHWPMPLPPPLLTEA